MATAVVPPLSLPACADASSGTAQSLVSEVAGAVEREEEREARGDAAGAAAAASLSCRCCCSFAPRESPSNEASETAAPPSPSPSAELAESACDAEREAEAMMVEEEGEAARASSPLGAEEGLAAAAEPDIDDGEKTATFSCAVRGLGSLNPSTAADPWRSMSSPTVTKIERRDPTRSEEEEDKPVSSALSFSVAAAGKLGIVKMNSSLLNRRDCKTLYLFVRSTCPPRESVALPNQAVNSRRSSLEGRGGALFSLSSDNDDEADGGDDDSAAGPREGAAAEEELMLLLQLSLLPLPLPSPLPLPLPPPLDIAAPLPPLTSAASAA